MKTIGITTTVPLEILIAAGYRPVDLNNILVSDPEPGRLITIAERAGFPLNCCSWIKGIYGACLEYGINDVLCVTGGDCSNTSMLMETLKLRGLNTVPFAFPDTLDRGRMTGVIKQMATDFGTSLWAAEEAKNGMKSAREAVRQLDEMTWRENTVSGWENHLWLVSSSDFNGDIKQYEADVRELIGKCQGRQPYPADEIRLAYIGVPSVFARELYPFIEQHGARVVFNEVQRQFTMPEPGNTLAEQYTSYTYPYSISERLADITAEIERRRIDGVIHYVQAFCHRGIGDIVFREKLDRPILTLEGNADFFLNNHLQTRLEAFLDMIERGRARHKNTLAKKPQ
ncbi:MAG: 2-hydroxyacyl-CoA dehydratase [Dehalococcoidales bacterium]|nr:2-hydroxyacyl-CoA dehydratase [Dehalococcoidales bacterium]